jgi:hypothetical protein
MSCSSTTQWFVILSDLERSDGESKDLHFGNSRLATNSPRHGGFQTDHIR